MAQVKTKNFPDVMPATQADLEDWYNNFYPRGSGPLGVMRLLCAALEEIAELRGYDTNFIELREQSMARFKPS